MEEQHYQLLDGKAVSAQMKKEMAEEAALETKWAAEDAAAAKEEN